jgi:hypothetical protein
MDGTRRGMRVIQYHDEFINDILLVGDDLFCRERSIEYPWYEAEVKSGTDRTITKFRWHALEFLSFCSNTLGPNFPSSGQYVLTN